jgi:hypothetical protein
MFTRKLLARIEAGNAAALARFGITPLHPRTGMAAVGVINGKPVWPVMGGSEPAPEPTPPADPPKTDPPADPPADPPKDETDWKAEARKWESRAKDNKSAADKLAEIEAANQTELEKAQKAAETEAARAQTATVRAVSAEVKALADGFRVRGDALLHLKDRGDLARFVDNDGDIDTKAIEKELADVLKNRPDLAPEATSEPTPAVPGARPVPVKGRPAAVPAADDRPRSLADASPRTTRPDPPIEGGQNR